MIDQALVVLTHTSRQEYSLKTRSQEDLRQIPSRTFQ
jgi:hypothetical protein